MKLDVQGQRGRRILDVDGQGGWGGLENWTILMDVIRVSSLILLPLFSAENILNSRLESTKWQLNIVSSKP